MTASQVSVEEAHSVPSFIIHEQFVSSFWHFNGMWGWGRNFVIFEEFGIFFVREISAFWIPVAGRLAVSQM